MKVWPVIERKGSVAGSGERSGTVRLLFVATTHALQAAGHPRVRRRTVIEGPAASDDRARTAQGL